MLSALASVIYPVRPTATTASADSARFTFIEVFSYLVRVQGWALDRPAPQHSPRAGLHCPTTSNAAGVIAPVEVVP